MGSLEKVSTRLIPKIEKSTNLSQSIRLVFDHWGKPCRALYGKMGVYSLHDRELGSCLYVGQSTDLGKRLRRFFDHRLPGRLETDKIKATFSYTPTGGERIVHTNIFIEVTTIANIHHLARFERTIIATNKPLYNKLLNYDKAK